MKNKIFLGAILLAACLFPMFANAQLEVKTNGNVEISQNLQVDQNVAIGTTKANNISLKIQHQSQTTDPYYGILSSVYAQNSMPTGAVCGIRGVASAATVTNNYPYLTHIVGVFGSANKPPVLYGRFSAGVAGVANYYGGVGVYGAIGSGPDLEIPTSSFGAAYAGYFNGGVMVNGTLTATNISIPSGLQQQENVQQLQTSLADNIRLLNPISYTINQNNIWESDIDAKELQGVHYGLIAQDVKKVYPELVYERGDKLFINYIELIPILIMKIQELSAEVDELKNNPSSKSSARKGNNAQEMESIQAILYQNNPNPFTIDTKIKYQLPMTTHDASLYIYNMNGLQVAEYPIMSFGEGSITVSAGTLDAGMYLYSLITDGQIIDTKRMILTK